MSITVLWALIALVGIPAGIIAGYFLRRAWAIREAQSAEAKARAIIAEARNKERELLIKAKDQALKVADDAKQEEVTRRAELNHLQNRLEKRESLFDAKLLELEQKQKEAGDKSARLDQLKEEIQKIREEQLRKLERVAELSMDEARRTLMENAELRAKEELLARLRKLQQTAEEQIETETRKILATAMQRLASPMSAESNTTVVDLPNEEMKGRIIGKEGRNIKALENLTGVEIIIDETPESIIISGFNLVRRHLAKRVLEKLMVDGRIHPGRIEETIEQIKKEMASEMKKAGEQAAYEVGVTGLDPRLLQLLGRLKYRTSYGQNQLQHAVEVGLLSGLIAEELGANVNVAKKGGLLHDIGKAIDHEVQGAHTQIGYEIMRKYGLPEDIAQMAIAHHEDIPQTVEQAVVKSADALSGARPGARKGTYENYVQRLNELETIAKSYAGVERAFAIQAGREVRVFVKPEQIDDFAAMKMAQEIAARIEKEMQYPGEIKVMVVREKRVVQYAR
ncbi:MAG: ribonuclease Y [Candidatus Kerfeldbacteria bacterium]|nr:ribonuclease Y [Candidatus Kerfeldbacteria bacterium]